MPKSSTGTRKGKRQPAPTMTVRGKDPSDASQKYLGIKDARRQFSKLVHLVKEERQEIHVGPRQSDDITIISSRQLTEERRAAARQAIEIDELKRLLKAATPTPPKLGMRPYAGLQERLEQGHFDQVPVAARERRLMPEAIYSNVLTKEEQITLGSIGDVEPRYRRRNPRA